MGTRFHYEPQSTLQKFAARCKHPLGWREKVTPWVFDKDGGTRFQLTPEEEALVRELSLRLSGTQPIPRLEAALDEVANAVLRRRRGYIFEEAVARLDAREWDARLSADGAKH
jgi:hypothetical protein